MKNSVRDDRQFDDQVDIPPEVDFRRGERGKYAHLFGEEPLDEELVAQFLRDKGFDVEKIGEDRFAKTPDFTLLREGNVVAYCEVKTFERDVWLDKKLAEAQPIALVGGARPDPIYNRISNAIHTAARQLIGMNLNHEVLNILVMVNRDKQALYQDLVSVITGMWDPLAGIHDKTHEQFSEGRIREEKTKIDLYIWLDVFKDESLKLGGFFFGNYENRNKACSLFGLNPESVITVA